LERNKQLEHQIKIIELAFNSSTNAMVITDKDGRVIRVNPVHEDVTGLPDKEFLGKRMFIDIANKDNEKRDALYNIVLGQGKIYNFYRRPYPKKDGSIQYLTGAMAAVKDSGQIIGAIITVDDITEQVETEKSLRENKTKLAGIVNSVTDAMVMLDREFNIVWINDIAKKLFGPDLVGEKCYRAYHRYDKVCEPCIVKQCFEDGMVYEFETEITGIDGNPRSFWCTVSVAAKYQDGCPKTVVEFLRDITEKRKLEAQLQQAQKMEAIGTLAGGIAHDFNNLLMGIEGNVSLMLLNINPNEPNYERLKNIERLVVSGAELTKQLLGFARGGKYEVKPTDLNKLIDKISKMFGRTRKEIRIHKRCQKDVWTVEVDKTQIEQVLLNLYVNAWQAMPRGGSIYIQTENIMFRGPNGMKPGNYVKVSVTDTGVGMDEKIKQRIFDPFFTTKEMGRGTGLGLASVYGIIKGHGGHIDVKSKKGQGTTFNVYLPASEKAVAITKKKPPGKIPKGTEMVLLVDDEDDIIDVGQHMLEIMGYKVLVAKSGKEAIDVYKKNQDDIEIIVLDMVMPGMGGGEAYDRLKEIDPDVKVLLSSGYSINGDATKILERGCDGFIQKPFNLRQLSQKIRDILDNQ